MVQIDTYLPLPFRKDGNYVSFPIEKVVEKIEKEMFEIQLLYTSPKRDILLKILQPQYYKKNDEERVYQVFDSWLKEVYSRMG